MKRRSNLDRMCDDVSTPSLSVVSSTSALQHANSTGLHGGVVSEFNQATSITVVGPPQIGRGSKPCSSILPLLRHVGRMDVAWAVLRWVVRVDLVTAVAHLGSPGPFHARLCAFAS
jgi:hypothetical protein